MPSTSIICKIISACALILSTSVLSGCATGMSALECGVESMSPTVMAALDSFESAAMSIRLSNRILLRSPLTENDTWPNDLFGAPDSTALLKIGVSLFGASQGLTLPTEIDPATGWPRPTSALYIFLKEREKLLNKDVGKDHIAFFKGKPQEIYFREIKTRKGRDVTTTYAYRNPLMAYGVVTNNTQEMKHFEAQMYLTANGYDQCDAFLRKADPNATEDIKNAACKDPALTEKAIEAALKEKTEDMALMEKNYGKLANRVHAASVAGADFSMAALVKIGCAVVNGIRALPNMQNEFKGLKGVYNAAMLYPRITLVMDSLGIYKNNLSLQYDVYSTMYKQIKGKYQIKDDEPAQNLKTKEALRRMELAENTLKQLEPKLQLALAGKAVAFSDQEALQLETLAAMFPTSDDMTRLAGLSFGQ